MHRQRCAHRNTNRGDRETHARVEDGLAPRVAFVAVLCRVGLRIAIAYEALALGRGGDGDVSDELGVRQAGVDHAGVVHAERLHKTTAAVLKKKTSEHVMVAIPNNLTAVGGKSTLLCAMPMAQWLPIHPCMNPPCATAATSQVANQLVPVRMKS